MLLRPGYSTGHIAAELQKAGSHSQRAFILWHYYHHGRILLKAGEYLFDKPANIIEIQKRLRRLLPYGCRPGRLHHIRRCEGDPKVNFGPQRWPSDTSLVSDIDPQCSGDLPVLAHDDHAGDGRRHGATVPAGGDADRTTGTSPRTVQPRILTSRSCDRGLNRGERDRRPEERPMVASVYYNRLTSYISPRCRSQHHLRGIDRRHYQGPIAPCRYAVLFCLQHLSPRRTAPGL